MKNFLVIIIFFNSFFISFAQPVMFDSSFGSNGVVITNLSIVDDEITSIALQSDGKILTAGYAMGNNYDFCIIRYLPDGSLDTSFNGSGIKLIDIGSGSYDIANGIALQTDGKIVVAGIFDDGKDNFAVVRLNSDGSMDTGFDGDGKVTTSFGPYYDLANEVLVQPDGKIVVAGASGNHTTSTYAFAFARYLSDGSLDSSFSNDGFNIVPILNGFQSTVVNSICIQPDNKILAVGHVSHQSDDFVVMRLLPDAKPDSTFNSFGWLTIDFPTSDNDRAESVLLQPDGKILVMGNSEHYTPGNRITIARLLPDATFDSSFGQNGIVEFNTGLNTRMSTILLQPNGKILVAGADTTMGVIRFETNGTIDWSVCSTFIYSPNVGLANGNSAVLQPDGKIIVAGGINSGTTLDFGLVRYMTDVNLSVPLEEPSGIKIFPNPFLRNFTVETNTSFSKKEITIYNILGHKVYENSFQELTELNIEFTGASGIYLIRVSDGSSVRTIKAIKN